MINSQQTLAGKGLDPGHLMWLMRPLMVLITIGTVGIALVGCSSLPPHKPSSQLGALYDGKSKIVHEMGSNPTNAQEAIGLGDVALKLGNRDEALFYFVKALEFDEKSYQTLCKIGAVHADKGNYGLAEIAYRLALNLAPKYPDALEGLGLIELQNHKYNEAKQMFNSALGADPKRWRSHNSLGLIADLRGEHANAASHYQTALQHQSNNAVLLNNLGYSKYLSGDWQGALQLYESALRFDPQYDQAWLNIALIYARQGNEKLAIQTFRRVLSEPDAYNNFGYICMMDGKRDLAESYFQRAISLSPSYHALAEENLRRVRSPSEF